MESLKVVLVEFHLLCSGLVTQKLKFDSIFIHLERNVTMGSCELVFFVLNQQYDDTIHLSCFSSSAIHPQREKEEPGGWRNKWQNPAQNLFSPPEKSLSLFEENVYFSCQFFKLKSKPIYLYISLCTLWCQKGCKPLHNNNNNNFFVFAIMYSNNLES